MKAINNVTTAYLPQHKAEKVVVDNLKRKNLFRKGKSKVQGFLEITT